MFHGNIRAFGYALRNPIAATRYIYIFIREATVNKTSKMSALLKVPPSVVTGYLHELGESDLSCTIKAGIARQRGIPIGGMTTSGRSPILYVICRVLRPKIVLETGVASGVSSTYILHALDRNQLGTLYSVDFPTSPDGLASGWLIPDRLRNRWHLTLGKSSEKLPVLLEEIPKVDVFLHDSDHSYKNMMFEFRTVWPHIREGGLLLSDDTHMNRSFFDFAREVNRRPIRFYLLSAIRK